MGVLGGLGFSGEAAQGGRFAMKTMVWIVAILWVSPTIASADTWRRTTDDLYRESYDAQSEEQVTTSRSAAEERAEAYRAMYAY